MKRPARAPSQLPESLQKRLSAYALVAGAAGVGVLALAQPTEARVVYTRTHKGLLWRHSLNLDLNHDGVNDFRFHFSPGPHSAGLGVSPLNKSNEAVGYSYAFRRSNRVGVYASALPAGVRIGPRQKNFQQGIAELLNVYGLTSSSIFFGQWKDAHGRYLGLKFVVSGETHYGWARLSVHIVLVGKSSIYLNGYAYETIPNKPIIAGQEHGKDNATLGRLAQGASGLSNGGKP
jgi:hypothetical protein